MSEQNSFDKTDRTARRSRKKREIALILPIIGILLLLTPVLRALTTGDGTSPLTNALVFIFSVWAALIIASFILSRALVPEIRDK